MTSCNTCCPLINFLGVEYEEITLIKAKFKFVDQYDNYETTFAVNDGMIYEFKFVQDSQLKTVEGKIIDIKKVVKDPCYTSNHPIEDIIIHVDYSEAYNRQECYIYGSTIRSIREYIYNDNCKDPFISDDMANIEELPPVDNTEGDIFLGEEEDNTTEDKENDTIVDNTQPDNVIVSGGADSVTEEDLEI